MSILGLTKADILLILIADTSTTSGSVNQCHHLVISLGLELQSAIHSVCEKNQEEQILYCLLFPIFFDYIKLCFKKGKRGIGKLLRWEKCKYTPLHQTVCACVRVCVRDILNSYLLILCGWHFRDHYHFTDGEVQSTLDQGFHMGVCEGDVVFIKTYQKIWLHGWS